MGRTLLSAAFDIAFDFEVADNTPTRDGGAVKNHNIKTNPKVFAIPHSEQATPDSTLFTTYSLITNGGQTRIDWAVCGSTQNTEGCYNAGSLGPFVVVGAMLEGI